MNSALNRVRQAVRKFHSNEEGLEALQVVMIIAVAAIMLIFIKANWEQVKTWYNDLVNQVLGWKQ